MLTRLERIHHEISGERLELIEFARKQRRESTDAEALLWSCLRDRRVNRRKFRRQHPIEPYILDFIVPNSSSASSWMEASTTASKVVRTMRRDATF